jgi:hypothetical protein
VSVFLRDRLAAQNERAIAQHGQFRLPEQNDGLIRRADKAKMDSTLAKKRPDAAGGSHLMDYPRRLVSTTHVPTEGAISSSALFSASVISADV